MAASGAAASSAAGAASPGPCGLRLGQMGGDLFCGVDRGGDLGVECLVARDVGEACEALGDAAFDAPQGDPHRGAQALGCDQALGQVVDRSELQRAHGGELVPLLGERDDCRGCGLIAQPAQECQARRVGVLR